MDKELVEIVSRRKNFIKDHSLKYLEFEGMVPNRLGKLREIVESLPNGKQKATAIEIIDWVHSNFQEVVKDWQALQEGSKLRNVLEDYVGQIKSHDNSGTSPKKDSR